MHTYIITYIHTYIQTYIRMYIHTHTYTYTPTYIHTYTYIHIYRRTYIYTYLHTYIHLYIHTYTHIHNRIVIVGLLTYIQTYLHTHAYTCRHSCISVYMCICVIFYKVVKNWTYFYLAYIHIYVDIKNKRTRMYMRMCAFAYRIEQSLHVYNARTVGIIETAHFCVYINVCLVAIKYSLAK